MKCCALSVSPWLAIIVVRCSSRWSLGCSRQALRSLTSSSPTSSDLHSKSCVIRWTSGRSLGGTYAPTRYQSFLHDVTVKLTTFGQRSVLSQPPIPSLNSRQWKPPSSVGSLPPPLIPCILNSVAYGFPW